MIEVSLFTKRYTTAVSFLFIVLGFVMLFGGNSSSTRLLGGLIIFLFCFLLGFVYGLLENQNGKREQ